MSQLLYNNDKKIVTIQYGEQSITFASTMKSTYIYASKPNDNPEETFASVNLLLSTIDPVTQKNMFEYLQSAIPQLLVPHTSRGVLEQASNSMFTFMMRIMPSYDTIRSWVVNTLRVPPDFKPTFDNKTSKYSREATYTLDEYHDHITLILVCKLCLPFLDTIVSTLFADYGISAYAKLVNHIPSTMTDMSAYKRLRIYTDAMGAKSEVSARQLFDGEINTIIYPDFTFGKVLMEKVAGAYVLNTMDKKHPISFLYKHFSNLNSGTQSRRDITDKFGTSMLGTDSDDDERGVYEAYRHKDRHSIATTVYCQYATQEDNLLALLKDKIDVDEYFSIKEYFMAKPQHVSPIHLIMLRWLFYNIIPHTSIYTATGVNIRHMLLMSHLLLRDMHPYLAVILVSHPKMSYGVEVPVKNYSVLGPSEDRALALRQRSKIHAPRFNALEAIKQLVPQLNKQWISLLRLSDMCSITRPLVTSEYELILDRKLHDRLIDLTIDLPLITPVVDDIII